MQAIFFFEDSLLTLSGTLHGFLTTKMFVYPRLPGPTFYPLCIVPSSSFWPTPVIYRLEDRVLGCSAPRLGPRWKMFPSVVIS